MVYLGRKEEEEATEETPEMKLHFSIFFWYKYSDFQNEESSRQDQKSSMQQDEHPTSPILCTYINKVSTGLTIGFNCLEVSLVKLEKDSHLNLFNSSFSSASKDRNEQPKEPSVEVECFRSSGRVQSERCTEQYLSTTTYPGLSSASSSHVNGDSRLTELIKNQLLVAIQRTMRMNRIGC